MSMCEDYPCCGHEPGDCNGQRYGSDASLVTRYHRKYSDPDYDPYYDEEGY